MPILTSTDVYDRLVNSIHITQHEGKIKFYLAGVDITVKQKDVVGNIIQEWVQGWMIDNHIDFAPNDNPQMPPDFYLDPSNRTHNLLEVKAFNREKNPGFDIADFRMYVEEIVNEPYMLDVDYLIFGYKMNSDSGIVTISDVWLKKVWEICRTSAEWPLNVQVKKNVVHKIRPGVWYSDRADFRPFACMEDFLSAVEETVYKNPATHNMAGTWKTDFLRSYNNYYHTNLEIKRWDEIKNQYM